MITLDGHILLYVFLLIFAGGLLFSLSHLYHAIRFGGHDPLAVATTGVFITGLTIIILLSFQFLSNIDWSIPFDLSVPAFNIGLPSSGNLNL